MRDVWDERKRCLTRGYAVKRNSGYGIGSINTRDTSPEFDISRHTHKKPSKNVKTTTVQYEPKVECTYDIIEDFDTKGNLGIILEFTGIRFLEGNFLKNNNRHTQNSITHYTNVTYRNHNTLLRLSTIDDILEVEVTHGKIGGNQLFSEEIYIPKLTVVYDSLSMEAVQKNGLVVVSYKKISEVDLHDQNSKIRSKNSFTIKAEEDIGALLKRIERNASAYGINFQGDIMHGKFWGKGISGKYRVNGQEITIYVDKIPPFVTTDFIKEKISEYFYKNKWSLKKNAKKTFYSLWCS